MFFTLFCIVLVMVSILHDLEIQTNFFFLFLIGPQIGPAVVGLVEPDGAGLGLEKKTRLLNGVGSSFGVRPVGRVRA